jgi:hypothetical protein
MKFILGRASKPSTTGDVSSWAGRAAALRREEPIMRKIVLVTSLFVVFSPFAIERAAAISGHNTPGAEHLMHMNRICEMQRRGEGPMYPNMCLPEYPPGPVDRQQVQGY